MQNERSLYVEEHYINKTEGYRFGDSGGPQEAWTDDTGKLYRSLRDEFGRCTGKMYIDTPDGRAKHVGWVFEKKMLYGDWNATEYYLREVWVTVYEKDDEGFFRTVKLS
jgi:hypothetical protein